MDDVRADSVAAQQGGEIALNTGVIGRSWAFMRRFLHTEAASGVFLLFVVIVAIALANSTWGPLYRSFLQTPLEIRLGSLALDEPLILWIDDGLMAIFFLVVGLEIKREILEGELSHPGQLALPGLAALGGMIVPAILYVAVNDLSHMGGGTTASVGALRGWAIPSATDIAFAIGALSLAGSRVPSSLRVFLLALAILDDLGAIIIIACFYTGALEPWALAATALGVAALVLLNRAKVHKITPYVLIGLVTLGSHASLRPASDLGGRGTCLHHPAAGTGPRERLAFETARKAPSWLGCLRHRPAVRLCQRWAGFQ